MQLQKESVLMKHLKLKSIQKHKLDQVLDQRKFNALAQKKKNDFIKTIKFSYTEKKLSLDEFLFSILLISESILSKV